MRVLAVLAAVVLCVTVAVRPGAVEGSWALDDDTVQDDGHHQRHHGRLLVLLIDGLRWDQVLDPDLRGFDKVIRSGVRAQHMEPVFPANSYVNYYAIATGLWPESNGVLDNYMYDARERATFWIGERASDYASFWWDEGDPIWITAARQNLMSHLHYWPGCEALIRGLTPTYCRPYEAGLTATDFSTAMKSAVKSLGNGNNQFAAVYTEVIDVTSHKYGPESLQTKEMLMKLDAAMSQLMELMRSERTPDGEVLRDVVDVIIVSDHGMASAEPDHVVRLHEYVDYMTLERYLCRATVTVCHLWPKPGYLDAVYDGLALAAHAQVYKRADMPERYHYKRHRRASPIIVVADLGWTLGSVDPPVSPQRGILGNHGYDPRASDMGAVFLATGPSFRGGHLHGAISAVDVYQLMCHVLHIHPSPHNGTWSHVTGMLVAGSGGAGHQTPSGCGPAVLVLATLLTVSLYG